MLDPFPIIINFWPEKDINKFFNSSIFLGKQIFFALQPKLIVVSYDNLSLQKISIFIIILLPVKYYQLLELELYLLLKKKTSASLEFFLYL